MLARQKIQRVGRRIRHYAAQITRVASSAIARSFESGISLPFLRWSSAAPAWDLRQLLFERRRGFLLWHSVTKMAEDK